MPIHHLLVCQDTGERSRSLGPSYSIIVKVEIIILVRNVKPNETLVLYKHQK